MIVSIFDNESQEALRAELELYYGSEDENERNELKADIVEKTQILLYLLPLRLRIIPQELIGDFYLSVAPDIDNILSGFKCTKFSYYQYITQYVKYKARFFLLRTVVKQGQQEEIIIYDSYISEINKHYYQDSTVAKMERLGKLEKSDLEEILNQILSYKPEPHHFEDKVLDSLHSLLEYKRNRKGFILAILTSQNEINREEEKTLASLYDCPLELFEKLSIVHRLWCLEKIEEEQALRETLLKHWKRLLGFEVALKRECDPDTRKELLFLKSRSLELMHKGNERINNRTEGMNVQALASLLAITASSVYVLISRVKTEYREKYLGFLKEEYTYEENFSKSQIRDDKVQKVLLNKNFL